MFGRATIRLGIGPHSSILIISNVLSFSINDCGFEVSLSSTGDNKDLLWLLLLNLL